MKKLLLILMLIALLGLRNNANAQSYEVLTGPFFDSTNYIPPPHLSSNEKNSLLKGTLTFTSYKQCNESWSSSNLGTCSESVCTGGCAMTSATMILTANCVNVDPGQLNTYLTNNGGYSGGCNILWTSVPNYPGATLTWYGFVAYSLSVLKSEIDGGNPVIVHVDHRYGGTGTCGHFVVVYGYNNSGTSTSDFLVSDPGTVTCPSGCNLSYYSICSETNALRVFRNVACSSCTLTGVTPTLVSPGTNSSPGQTITTTTPTLSWNAVSGATNYDVDVSISPYGTSNIVYQQPCASGTSLTVPSGYLYSGNLYRWNSQANVSCGSCMSNNASPLYFQIQESTCTGVSITNSLSNQSATVGGQVAWSVSVNGTAPFNYQWYKNGSPISGATNNSYLTPSLTLSDNGNKYYCYVTNCSGNNNATSNTGTLTVTSTCTGVSITNSLSPQNATVGEQVTWNVYVSGTGPFNYQWYKNNSAITGATNNSYLTPTLTLSDNGNTYYCYVTNCSGNNNATSNTASLTVTSICSAVSITNTLTNQTATVGGQVTWSVNVNGTAPFNYQWYKSGSTISGATNSSYQTPTLALSDNGNTYYCYVTNCSGSYYAKSNTAILYVTTTCVAPVSPSGITATQTTINSGGSTTLQVTGGTLNSATNWVWYTNGCGGPEVGEGSSITVYPVSNTTYYVMASACGTNTTCQSIPITVNQSCSNSQSLVWGVQTNSSACCQNVNDMAKDANGNLYLTGYIEGTVSFGGGYNLTCAGSSDIFVAKYDSSGVIQWAVSYGSTADNWGYGITTDINGNVYVTGFFQISVTFGNYTLSSNELTDFIIKLDPNGGVQWAKKINSTFEETATCIVIDNNSNIYVSGYLLNVTTGTDGIFLAKYNEYGTQIWYNTYGCFSPLNKKTFGIAIDNSGNILICGEFSNSLTLGSITLNTAINGGLDGFISKIDANGNVIWAKQLTSPKLVLKELNWYQSMTVDAANNIYVVGNVDTTAIIGNDTIPLSAGIKAIIAKYDKNGNPRWVKASTEGSQYPQKIIMGNDNIIYCTGSFGTSIKIDTISVVTNGGSFIINADTSGAINWIKAFGSTQAYTCGIVVNSSNDIYLAGTFDGTMLCGNNTLTSSNYDIFLAKYVQCEPPIANINYSSGTLCAGQTELLSTGYCSSYKYQWELDNAVISSETLVTYSASGSGSYTVLVSSASDCKSTSNAVALTFNTVQPPTIAGDTMLCSNSDVEQLDAGYGYSNYIWSNGLSSQIISVNPGKYTVTVTYSNGCSASNQINIGVYPPTSEPTVISPVTYCQNETASLLTATGSSLLWYTTEFGGTGSTNAPLPNTANGGTTPYYVSQSINGCEGPRAVINVIIYTQPTTPTISQNGNYLLSNTVTGNQWYDINGVIKDSTSFVYTPTKSGCYYVIVTKDSCSSDPSNIICYTYTGVNEFINENRELKIYPNPANDILNIEFSTSSNADKYVLTLRNIGGQEMVSKNVEFTNVYKLDLTKLTNGMYFLSLQNDKENYVRKVVVQK